jgi:hypothetical protein
MGSAGIFCGAIFSEFGSISVISGKSPTMKWKRLDTPPALRMRSSRSPGSASAAMVSENFTLFVWLPSTTLPVTPLPVTSTVCGTMLVPDAVTSTVVPRCPPAG